MTNLINTSCDLNSNSLVSFVYVHVCVHVCRYMYVCVCVVVCFGFIVFMVYLHK